MITQLPKCRVLSPVKGVQRRKPTAKNRPKARPKAFILYLDPGEQRWKFKEIRTTDFSSQASKNSPAAGVHWVGTRQPSLGASSGMCSHNLLRKAASDRSLPDLQGHGSFIMPPSPFHGHCQQGKAWSSQHLQGINRGWHFRRNVKTCLRELA